MATNTTSKVSPRAISRESGVRIKNAEMAKKELLAYYKGEPLVERAVSPLYEPYLGKVLQISLNGITIAFPIDGSTHKIPQSFADELDSRRIAIDATIRKSKKMSAIQTNAESFPGELAMF